MVLKAPLADKKTSKIEIDTVDHQCLSSTVIEDKNWLWHHMYVHLNFRGLGMLNQKKMVYSLPQVKEPSQVCKEWYKEKQARKAFKHDLSMKSKQNLELVHSDVCWPFEVRSNEGNYNFLTFIDEFTRYMWIYLIKRKGELFTHFKKFKLHVEK